LAIRTLERELGVLPALLFKANFGRHAVGQMPVIIFVHMRMLGCSSVVAGVWDRFILGEHLLPSFFKGMAEGLYCAVWNLSSPPKKGNTPPII